MTTTSKKKATKSTAKQSKAAIASKTASSKVGAELSPELKEACQKIRGLMNKADNGESKARYEISAEVHRVMTAQGKYGKQSVRRIARELGCTTVTLYNYARVAECWTEKTFLEHATRCTPKKVPLTFWHFVVIAKQKDAAKRAEMLEEAFRTGTTARQMEKAAAPPARPATMSVHQQVATANAMLGRVQIEAATDATLGELEITAEELATMMTKLEMLAASLNTRIAEKKKKKNAATARESSEQMTETTNTLSSSAAAE